MSAQITMYSALWCGDCRRSKAFLDARNVEYNYIDIELDEVASDKVIEINGGMRSIPVIVFPDGTHMTEPSDIDLEAKLVSLAIL
jgi:mycoredoxin